MSHVNTARVSGRRVLRFESLDDIAADVERLAKAEHLKTLGNWSAGQIFQHLAIVMNGQIDGMEISLPLPIRMLMPLIVKLRKNKFLTQPMPTGIKLPTAAAKFLLPPETSLEDGVAAIRAALKRLRSTDRVARHPFLGALTSAEWVQVQCRHCEMHLSFLVPEGQ